MTTFFRLLDSGEKATTLWEAVVAANQSQCVYGVYDIEPKAFRVVPGAPFSYWVEDKVRDLFRKFPRFEGHHGTVKQGLATTDDFRFVRASWEPPEDGFGVRWFPLAKGGNYSPYYADLHLCVDWRFDGAQSWAIYEARREVVGGMIKNPDYYFRPGLTWPLRTHRFCPQALPAGAIISVRGFGIFCAKPLPVLGMFSSAIVDAIMKMLSGRDAHPQFDMGDVSAIPVPPINGELSSQLTRLATRGWSLKRVLDSINEVSHAFLQPVALRPHLGPFDPLSIEAELADIQLAIDDLAFRAYGFDSDDRASIEALAAKTKSSTVSLDAEAEEDESGYTGFADASVSLHSWAVGVAFHRFDLRLATGERHAPPEPDPFDPLPTRSPAMVPEVDAAKLPARTMFVDDLGHALDLSAQAGGVLERVGFAPENPETLRRWFAREFFPLHIKMYSKSRRKAPIYWQLATPSASYSVWLYIHAFTSDTLYEVQEIAETKLRHEENRLDSLRADLGPSPKAAERKSLAARETFVEELRAFLAEVKRVTPLWNPSLDDGVIINFAPLWRLVPHHKPWQLELKTTWDALCSGKHDWAQLAMHLWPERVVPKCATDRSLAIAHGLEEIFWQEGEAGKWKPRRVPTRPLEEIVRERTSPAVKTALKSLVEAPLNGSSGRRDRLGRKHKSTGDAV